MRFIITTVGLLLGLAACAGQPKQASTLAPTAAAPAYAGLAGSATVDRRAIPPTWTATYFPDKTETPVTPSPSVTQYRRTATPTMPTWTPSATPTASNTPTPTDTPTPWPTIQPEDVWTLDQYPRPPGDNGWGMHWFPTYEQDVDTINKFVVELSRMHIKWLVFLNDGTDIGRNDYLVQRLVGMGIEPVMRLYVYGVVPYDGNLPATIHHYHELGVNYFQLYNEPNLFAEAAGRAPNPDWYITHWAQAAEIVVANGGLPGLGALSPGGE
ncbi:MAG: hypothetical protein JXA42_18225, partial [Anaerolineales bacterium]|nr:hypothetical protein [Anaerolineales bacterium]